MEIKTKKQNADGFVKLETSGEVKEVLINEDFLHSNEASIAICFKGKNSSGIVEMTPKELESLYKEIHPKLHFLGDIKVMKFENDS